MGKVARCANAIKRLSTSPLVKLNKKAHNISRGCNSLLPTTAINLRCLPIIESLSGSLFALLNTSPYSMTVFSFSPVIDKQPTRTFVYKYNISTTFTYNMMIDFGKLHLPSSL